MRRTLLFLSLASIVVSSCNKSKDAMPSGLYTEQSPVAARSQLDFISGNRVVMSEANGGHDTFTYILTGNSIELTPAWANEPGSQWDFKMIDKNSFQIENLYPHAPEDPKSYMIYKK